MRNRPRPMVLLLFFAALCRTSAAQIVFDDGGQHTITESYVDEQIFIVTNHTTVTHRGEIIWQEWGGPDFPLFSFTVSEGSELLVDGGVLNTNEYPGSREGLVVSDSSVTVNSGDIQTDRMSFERSELNVTGGKLWSQWDTDYTLAGGIFVHDSVFNLTDGEVGSTVDSCCFASHVESVTLTGTTVAQISGGRILMGGAVSTEGDAPITAVLQEGKELALTGGEISVAVDENTLGVAVAGSQSKFLMSGGLVQAKGSAGLAVGVDISGSQAEFLMTDGLVRAEGTRVMGITADQGKVDVSGGELTLVLDDSSAFFRSAGSSRVVVRGGRFRGERTRWSSETNHTLFEATENGRMTIAGGQLTSELDVLGIRAADASEVVIVGSDFNLPISESVQDTRGTITGTLRDGNPFSWSFERDEGATIRLSLAGDYNGDGVIDAADVDLQTVAMKQPDPDLATFDENNDQSVDMTDRIIWVRDRAHTWVGDADLNGEFNSSDLTSVFQAGHYEDGMAMNSDWATGDWNGDGDFDSSDLVAAFIDGGYDQGPRIGVNAVPEPSSLAILFAGLIGTTIRRRLVGTKRGKAI